MAELVDQARERAARWREAQNAEPGAEHADPLAQPELRDFTVDVVDALLRPDSFSAAATHLRRVAQEMPDALPWYVRLSFRAGGAVAPVLPAGVVPIARTALKSLIGNVVLDARPHKLTKALEGHGTTELSVLTEPAVGEKFAATNREALAALIARDDVSAVSFALRDMVALGSPWGFEEAVEKAVLDLADLYEAAKTHQTRITVEVRELRDLDVTIAMLMDVLEQPRFVGVRAGLGVPAALPESLEVLHELTAWAAASPDVSLTLRLIEGAGSEAERAASVVNSWPDPALDDPDDVAAAMIRGIDAVLAGKHAGVVRLAIATDDLDVIAYAVERAASAPEDLDVVVAYPGAQHLGDTALIVHAHTVHPKNIDAAAGAIARVLMREPAPSDPDRLERIVGIAADPEPQPHRTQDRAEPAVPPATEPVLQPKGSESTDLTQAVIGIARSAKTSETSPLAADVENMLFGGAPYVETAVFREVESSAIAYGAPGFRNAAISDPALEANRVWAADVFEREAEGHEDLPSIADAVTVIRHGDGAWEVTSAADRAHTLELIAYELELRRSALIAAAQTNGTLFADADRDVSTAVDFANYYAATVRELDSVSGAVLLAPGITAVVADAADAIASAAEGVLASLATGGAVVMLAEAHTRAVASIVMEAVAAAGVPDDAAHVAFGTTQQAIALNVDQIVIAGSQRAVEAAVALQPRLGVSGRVRGTNTVIVTPSADIDTAVASVVTGAFARAGRAYGTTNIAVFVGSIARSDRLLAALTDATTSLRVGDPSEAAAQVGPLAAPPTPDELWALTELEPGQSWLVKPEQITDTLWSPGIRIGVTASSRFASERFAVPVLGIVHTTSVSGAIDVHNTIAAGGVAALETTDASDLALWLRRIQAGSLFVGRASVDPVVQRQPEGGWNAAAAGTAAKAGGPNRLATLGSWRPTTGRGTSGTLHLRGLDTRVVDLVESAQSDLDYESFDWVRRGALSDALAWDREFGHVRDVSRLGVERNLLRYRPAHVAIRATHDTPLATTVRLVVAAVRAQCTFTLSTAAGLPAGFRRALGEANVSLFVETDEEFVSRVTAGEVPRVRLAGPGASDVAADLRQVSSTAIYADTVTTAGRVELLAYLREQSVTVTGRALALFRDVI